MGKERRSHLGIIQRVGAIFCAVLLALSLVLPVTQAAGREARVIRVGRFPYEEQLKRDANGNYSGYGYDYLQALAEHAHWQYEFVDAPWSECLAMLARGEIDLLGAVMRSPERELRYDFSALPAISGYGVLATSLSNEELPYEDFAAFDGLTVGALRDNQHLKNFLDYGAEKGFTPKTREYDTEAELGDALERGEVKAVILTNILRSATLRVVATFGENDGFFATTKGNRVVLEELNDAMRAIRMEDPYFNMKLDEKYYDLQAATVVSFTRAELGFIQESQPIPCVYIPDAIPINSYDRDSGQVRGIAVDLCALLEERTGLRFTWIHPQSAGEAVALLRAGEALLLPAKYHDFNWAEQNGAVLSEVYLQGQMVMVSDRHVQSAKVVALYDEGSQSRLTAEALAEGATFRQYDTMLDCMDAVHSGEADATFINSTIASYLGNDPKYAQLKTTPLYGFPADVAMAVSGKANPLLLSVLNKGLRSISTTEMNQIVLSQMKREEASALANFLYSHPVETVMLVLVISLLLIITLSILLNYRRRRAQEMRRDLYIDPLTGYPSYHALTQEAHALVRKHPGRYAVVYMDIHQFKVINDTFGYEAGDWVLISTADVLRQFVENGERFARVYADTFVLLLHYDSQTQLRARLEELGHELERLPVEEKGITNLLFCGGVYLLPEEFDGLEKASDRANYAKDSISRYYANTFVFYNDIMRSRVLAEKELEGDMLPALERREFIPYYQPKVNAITGKVVGAEALVRWEHPKKGLLKPGEFLPFYEKNGFIVKIDLAVFERVCEDMREWMTLGYEMMPISVNFSRRHMWDDTLPQKLKKIADHYAIPTELLEIEVTETEEFERTDTALDFVNALKAIGFGISIDDYGTGYSSIAFLQQLPLDALKLDREFVLNAMQSGKASDLMRYLVVAMQRNKVRVVCEGVETEEQREFIISLNCRFIQGFLYSKPLPRMEFEDYLEQHGVDATDRLDFIAITEFDEKYTMDSENFLTRVMPSWLFTCEDRPGFPVLYISPNFLEGMGYSTLEFQTATGGHFLQWVHPDDREQAIVRQSAGGRYGEETILQYRIRKKNGEYLWVREINRRVISRDGQEMLMGVCTNVTDMVDLQAEKERLVDAIPGGVGELVLEEEGPIIRHATDNFYAIIGHTREEMEALGNNVLHIIYEQDQTEAANDLRRVMDNDMATYEITFRIRYRDESLHWVSLRSAIAHGDKGKHATVVIYNSDAETYAKQADKIARTKLELALSMTHQAVFEYDIDTQIVYSHSGLERYGLPSGATFSMSEDIVRKGAIHPDYVEKVHEVQRRLRAGEAHISYVMCLRSDLSQPDSAYLWLRIAMSTIYDEDGQPVRAVGVVEDISGQKRFEDAFTQESQFRRAFTESSLMAYELNLTRGTMRRISGSRGFRLEEFLQTLPHPERYDEALPAAARALVAQEDRERFCRELSTESLMELYHQGVFEREVEYRRLTLEDRELWSSVLTCMLMDQMSGDVMGYVYHRDIQERKEAERDLAEQAARDPLTDVFNRATTEQAVRHFLQNDVEDGCVQAFLMLDLDHFKEINDTFGHLVGDKCLMHVAQILTAESRRGDIVGRMGGDEFAVLLKNLPNEGVAETVARRISQAVKEIGGALAEGLKTGVSVGIAIAPREGNDFESLYRLADAAMYEAKRQRQTLSPVV